MEVTRRPVETATRAPGGETNAYVVGSDPALLVDPAGRTDELDTLCRDRGVENVLVTHAHPDHVGGVAAYGADLGATVWALRGRVDRFRSATGIEPDRTFRPPTTLPVGEGRVRLVDAPGHAPDHAAVVVDGGRGSARGILCGDCAVREGSVAVAAPEGDLRAYVATLRRLWARNPRRLYPGHGPEIDRPRAVLERLLEHRRRRERRVLAAVASGAETPEAILESAYEKDLTGVRDLARATIVAHLEKLAVEGRVRWDGERARRGTD